MDQVDIAWEKATEEQRDRWRAWAAERRRDKADHPLAYAELWTRGKPRTSQLRNAQERLSCNKLYRFELGGNVSGKSEGGAIEDWLYALGRDHEDVIRFAILNGIDLDLTDIPSGPGTVVACAPDSGDSREYVRPKVAKYAPQGCKWRNRDGNGVAEVVAPGGAKIIFKSVDQGRDGHQGTGVRRYRFDEEPKDIAVVHEASMRVVAQRGHISLTMTPLMGWTPLLERHVRDMNEDTFVRWLHGADNPHISADMLERVLRTHGRHERAARAHGEIVALEGRIYDMWNRDIHVIGKQPIPDDWPRFRAVDFGTRNPTSVGWYALDPHDDVLHRYRWHYQAGKATEHHARRVIALSETDCPAILGDDGEQLVDEDGDPEFHDPYSFFIADPAGTAERITWSRMGLWTSPAYKGPGSVRAGISAMSERLELDANGKPHLVVHDPADPFIREIESYIWDTTNRKGDMADQPLKKNDHAMDECRYLVHHLSRVG